EGTGDGGGSSSRHHRKVANLAIHSHTAPDFGQQAIKFRVKKWVDVFVRVAKRKAAKLGLPLALITMDPAMYFAGVDDNNSWSQWTDVCKALIVLAQKCGCPVLVVDHYGKDEERGLVGSAAKEAAAHFVLGSGGDRENRKNRELQVRKMKDGQGYICVDFSLDT